MIDNPQQVERLLERLASSLPLAATVAPELASEIREQSAGIDPPRGCTVTWVSYSGDEGGIICKLNLGREDESSVLIVSITHLVFDARSPLTREIAAYQKHRIKRLRRAGRPARPEIGGRER